MDTSSATKNHRLGGLLHEWPAALSLMPALMVPALEYLPGIPQRFRGPLIIMSILLACIGLYANRRRQKRIGDLEREVTELRRIASASAPDELLRHIADSLFRDGAWRLTIYRKIGSSSGPGELVQVISIASDGDEVVPPHTRFAVDERSSIASAFRQNLSNPRYRKGDQSGSFPDEVLGPDWERWHSEILGESSSPLRSSRFRPRKFAWYAAQEPRSQSVLIVVAESAGDTGISFDVLDQSLTPAWLYYVHEIAEMDSALRRVGAPDDLG